MKRVLHCLFVDVFYTAWIIVLNTREKSVVFGLINYCTKQVIFKYLSLIWTNIPYIILVSFNTRLLVKNKFDCFASFKGYSRQCLVMFLRTSSTNGRIGKVRFTLHFFFKILWNHKQATHLKIFYTYIFNS